MSISSIDPKWIAWKKDLNSLAINISDSKLEDRIVADKLASQFIVNWKEGAMSFEHPDIIVISLGSSGSAMQQYPPFIEKSGLLFSILNIDPNIWIKSDKSNQFFDEKEYKNSGICWDHPNIHFLPIGIGESRSPEAYETLNKSIKELIEEKKTVIFISYLEPTFFNNNNFKKLIVSQKDHFQKSFFLLGAYFDNLPVCLYKEKLCDLLSEKGFIAATQRQLLCYKVQSQVYQGASGSLSEPIAKKKLDKTNKNLANYLVAFPSLETLKIEDIFHRLKPKSDFKRK
jgi:hypothetical protein